LIFAGFIPTIRASFFRIPDGVEQVMSVPGDVPEKPGIELESAESGDGSVAAAVVSDGETGEAPSTSGATDPESVLEQLETTQMELADMREQYMRAVAEVENVRRRSEQEILKVRKFALEGFASELLAVKDSLDLAASVELGERDDPLVANMHEGLSLTRRQLDKVFEKFGIATLDPATGEKLNPDLHQAMSRQESAEVAPNHILQVIQKGFTLNDRLLRPAMVIVARAPAT
jgi:molecular chaperone GrpE